MRQILREETCNTGIEELKLESGTLTSKRQEIVEQLVTYFKDIGKNLASNIRKPTLPVSVPRRAVNSIGFENRDYKDSFGLHIGAASLCY
ncbi:hypothetical protein HHI36_005138 [Cryptolaemus montrouzieri]|uniref:Uncharacterized protein n=1 Tax=Cryptolaemus montrouzieri TaxID=559131 RepID=A0ABD2NTH1_9CUCU